MKTYEWVSVTVNMPVPGSPVLAVYLDERYPRGVKKLVPVVVRACWIPEKFSSDDYEGDDAVYDENTDEYYWPQGWYEWNETEETHFALPDTVTHWMPLPEVPQK